MKTKTKQVRDYRGRFAKKSKIDIPHEMIAILESHIDFQDMKMDGLFAEIKRKNSRFFGLGRFL